MPFKPGQSGNPKGKPPGITNALTRTVKEALQEAFDRMQVPQTPEEIEGLPEGTPAHKSLYEWGCKNPDDFYKLCGKLIPAKLEHEGNIALSVLTGVPRAGDHVIEGEIIEHPALEDASDLV
jgi:hypothetical protein